MEILSIFQTVKFKRFIFFIVTIFLAFSTYHAINTAGNALVLTDSNDQELVLDQPEKIRSINGIQLDNIFFYRLPLFIIFSDEKRWWYQQHIIAESFTEQATVTVSYKDKNQDTVFNTRQRNLVDALGSISLILTCAFVFFSAALWNLKNYKDSDTATLAIFYLFCSAYLVTAAPAISRQITLPYESFKLLIDLHYIANGGLISLLHYSFVFPKKPVWSKRVPGQLIPIIGYSWMTLCSILYLSDKWAFASSDPAMFIIVATIAFNLLSAIRHEKDKFLKRQIIITIGTPALIVLFFALFNAFPSVIGNTPMMFNYFSLLSLLLPFALTTALDNVKLYRERIEVQRIAILEKENIRQDLHDNMLGHLANISIISQSIIDKQDNASSPDINASVKHIKDISSGYSKHVREVMGIINQEESSFDEVADHLNKHAEKILGNHAIEFFFQHKSNCANPVSPDMKFALHAAFNEAIVNTIKHAEASEVHCHIKNDDKKISMSIEDNGIGFNDNTFKSEHYGIGSIKARIAKLSGTVSFSHGSKGGTLLTITLPNNHQNSGLAQT